MQTCDSFEVSYCEKWKVYVKVCIVLLLFLWNFVYLLDFQLLQNKFLKTTYVELPLIVCQESDNYTCVGSTSWASLVASMVKNPSINAGDMGSIPGSGRSPGEGNARSGVLGWRIPWTSASGVSLLHYWSMSILHHCIFFGQYHTAWLLWFYNCLKIREYECSRLFVL